MKTCGTSEKVPFINTSFSFKVGIQKPEHYKDNEIEGILDYFKLDVTDADKKKLAIKMLKDETREMRRKWQEKMREMNAMLGKVSKVQESSTDGEDDEEDRKRIETSPSWDTVSCDG